MFRKFRRGKRTTPTTPFSLTGFAVEPGKPDGPIFAIYRPSERPSGVPENMHDDDVIEPVAVFMPQFLMGNFYYRHRNDDDS